MLIVLVAAGVGLYYWLRRPQTPPPPPIAVAAAIRPRHGSEITDAVRQPLHTSRPFRPGYAVPCSQKTDYSLSYNVPQGDVTDVENGLARYHQYSINRENMNENFLRVQM